MPYLNFYPYSTAAYYLLPCLVKFFFDRDLLVVFLLFNLPFCLSARLSAALGSYIYIHSFTVFQLHNSTLKTTILSS